MQLWPFSPDPEYRAAWEAHADQVDKAARGEGEDCSQTNRHLDEVADRTPFWRKVW